jgi:hypothetical protein
MDETGGLTPRDVLTFLVQIGVSLFFLWSLTMMLNRDKYAEVFIGVCILIAGHTIAHAIRNRKP